MGIDPRVMYQAGFSGRRKGKTSKAYLADTIDKMIPFIGQIALNGFAMANGELKEFRKKSQKTKTDINTLVNDVGASMNPSLKANLKLWQNDYDKGARMASYGLTRKKRQKGQDLMDVAYTKMQKSHSILTDFQTRNAINEGQALMHLGENPGTYNGQGWSSGSSPQELRNGSSLANGTFWNNVEIDYDTGDWVQLQEQELLHPTNGNVIEDDRGNPIMTTVPVPIQNVDWPETADDSIQGASKGYIENGIANGKKQVVWDEMYGNYMKTEIASSINGVSETARRHYYFGGLAHDFSTGTMESSSPAHIKLLGMGYDPNDKEKWAGGLDLLRESVDFSKNGEAANEISDLLWNTTKKYHENSYGVHKPKGGGSGGSGGLTANKKLELQQEMNDAFDIDKMVINPNISSLDIDSILKEGYSSTEDGDDIIIWKGGEEQVSFPKTDKKALSTYLYKYSGVNTDYRNSELYNKLSGGFAKGSIDDPHDLNKKTGGPPKLKGNPGEYYYNKRDGSTWRYVKDKVEVERDGEMIKTNWLQDSDQGYGIDLSGMKTNVNEDVEEVKEEEEKEESQSGTVTYNDAEWKISNNTVIHVSGKKPSTKLSNYAKKKIRKMWNERSQ